MSRRISLFGRKRTGELGNTSPVMDARKDELLALKLQQVQQDAHQSGSLQQVPIDMVQPDPSQPRKAFKNMDSLAASVQEKGILQPIIVKMKNDDGKYTIIVGERRFQAAKIAGLKTVPCIIRQENDANTLILQLLENDQRESVSPLEESAALSKLIDDLKVSKNQVAKELGRDASWVSIRLGLQHASDDIKSLVRDGLVEDIRTLHELRMLEKEMPDQSRKLVTRVRKNQITGSYRDVIAGLRKQGKKHAGKAVKAKPRTVYGMERQGDRLILDVGSAQSVEFVLTSDVLENFLANTTSE